MSGRVDPGPGRHEGEPGRSRSAEGDAGPAEGSGGPAGVGAGERRAGARIQGRTRSRRRERAPIRDRPGGPSATGGPAAGIAKDGRSERPLRVLALAPSGALAGYCHDLCNALAERGSTVHLLTSREGRRSIAGCGTRRYREKVAFGEGGRGNEPLARLRALIRLLPTAGRYDVVHWHGRRPGLVEALWLGWVRRRATVACTAHGLLEADEAPDRWHERIRGAAYRACDLVFAHNREEERRLWRLGVARERVVRIRHGSASHLLDREILEPPGPSPRSERPTILYLGPVSRDRGADVLLRAVNHLRRYLWDFRVVLAGRPAGDPSTFQDLVRDLGVESFVELRLGTLRHHEVAGYLQQASVLALPYREPRDGDAAASACTFGKPVVASRVGGVCELVEDAGNGLLVQPDDPSALAEALSDVLRDPDLRRRCETNSLIYARTDLSWRRIGGDTGAAYRRVVDPS